MKRWLSLTALGLAGVVGCQTPIDGPERPAPGPSGTSAAGASGAPLPSSTGAAGAASAPSLPVACESQPPPTAPLALLTRREYDNTVFDLLADDSHPAAAFPPENQAQGFDNFTGVHQASPLLVEKYLDAAEVIAERAVKNRLNELAPCEPGSESQCGASFVRTFGARAFRRPLQDEELSAFDELFQTVHARTSFAAAIQAVIAAMLQSPQFLYRVDTLRSPSPETGALPLSPYQLASRLSYFLTGSMPDAELLAAASARTLETDAQIEQQVRRLLATPRAKDTVRSFHRQWLGLESLPTISRELPSLGFSAQDLGADWLASINRFLDYVYWENGKASALFESQQVFVTPRLAQLYGTPAPSEGTLAAATMPDRAGILTQPALMALLAHSNQTAPVLRGVFVRERLMCIPVPQPPPSVNATPPDPDPSATTRERFRVHTEQPECSGCHQLIDGIGFGLEAYDEFGRHRDTENGLSVDVSGEVVGTGDAELDGKFDGALALGARLAQSQRVQDCLATNWYRYAFGRLETTADTCSLDDVKRRFEASGGDLTELLLAITQSIAFRFRPALAEEP